MVSNDSWWCLMILNGFVTSVGSHSNWVFYSSDSVHGTLKLFECGIVGFVRIESFSSMWREDPFQTVQTDQTAYLFPACHDISTCHPESNGNSKVTPWRHIHHFPQLAQDPENLVNFIKSWVGAHAVVFSMTGSDAELVFGEPTVIQFENPPQASSRILRSAAGFSSGFTYIIDLRTILRAV